jgi:hypothetical protein
MTPAEGVKTILSIDLGSREMTAALLARIHSDGLYEVLDIQTNEPLLMPAAIPYEEALRRQWEDCINDALLPPTMILCSREFYRFYRAKLARGTRFRKIGADEALDLGLKIEPAMLDGHWGYVDRRKLKRARRRLRRQLATEVQIIKRTFRAKLDPNFKAYYGDSRCA